MSETMTAAELAAVYEPAFAAAGGGPIGIRYIPCTGVWVRDAPTVQGVRQLPREMDDADAANACRCWAHDWLVKQCAFGEMSPPQNDIEDQQAVRAAYYVKMKNEDADRIINIVGRSIHHALAAAVIAVAKVKT